MLFPESKVYDRQQQQEIQYGFGMDDVLKILGLTLFFCCSLSRPSFRWRRKTEGLVGNEGTPEMRVTSVGNCAACDEISLTTTNLDSTFFVNKILQN